MAQKTISGHENNVKKEVIFTNLVGTLVMLLMFAAFVFARGSLFLSFQ